MHQRGITTERGSHALFLKSVLHNYTSLSLSLSLSFSLSLFPPPHPRPLACTYWGARQKTQAGLKTVEIAESVFSLMLHVVGLSISVSLYKRTTLFLFASNLSSSGSSHVGSRLFPNEEQKRVGSRFSDVFFPFTTMALFMASLKQSECWARNDSPRGRVFSSFRR